MKRLTTSKIVLVVGLLMALTTLALADGETKTLTGHLVDKACSGRFVAAATPQEASAGHSKKCALMEKCAASGYGVFSDGKYYEFDAKGTELAKAAFEKSTKEKGATFKVVGKVEGAKISVVSITEAE
jgi:hypothetical protein